MILSSTCAVLNTVFQFLLEHQKTVVADLGLHC
jgi:hypothetical protein